MRVKFTKNFPEDLRECIEDVLLYTADIHGISDRDFTLILRTDTLTGVDYAETSEHQKTSKILFITFDTNLYAKETSKMVRRIAIHEMTHVKQFIKDGLALWVDGEVAFRGKSYLLTNDAEYWLAPWEIEARGYEEGIYTLWKRMNG